MLNFKINFQIPKSTFDSRYDFLLLVTSNCARITYRLRDIFAYRG